MQHVSLGEALLTRSTCPRRSQPEKVYSEVMAPMLTLFLLFPLPDVNKKGEGRGDVTAILGSQRALSWSKKDASAERGQVTTPTLAMLLPLCELYSTKEWPSTVSVLSPPFLFRYI